MTVPSYTEETVELIRPALPLDPSDGTMPISWGSDGIPTWGQPDEVIRGILDALAAAGRLVPPGSETREEWGVRFTRSDDGKTDDRAARDRDDALRWIAELERERELDKAPHGWAWTIAHAPLRRLRICTPWSPSVPDTKEET